ncbi:MAG TPA: hypothetical protein VFD36_29480 [Kofleriaceae bacterium]|nr:hypothetical protein [Kofleriaceae bacterium]
MAPSQDVGAVQRSQEFYRLKQVIQSPGDIFELNESAKAIYIGPDSDLAEVQVTYFNPDEPDSLETAVVSVNGPLVGRLDSLPSTIVSSTGQPARILVSPVDIVNNDYNDPDQDGILRHIVPAKIDLLVALKALPDIPQTRADRTIRLSRVPYIDATTDIIVPVYGRRMMTVNLTTNNTGGTVSFLAVTLTHGGKNRPRYLSGAITLPGLPVDYPEGYVIRASNDLGKGFAGLNSGSYLNYESLTKTQTGSVDENPLNKVRGQFDLLIIRLDTGKMNERFYADMVIRLSDRET